MLGDSTFIVHFTLEVALLFHGLSVKEIEKLKRGTVMYSAWDRKAKMRDRNLFLLGGIERRSTLESELVWAVVVPSATDFTHALQIVTGVSASRSGRRIEICNLTMFENSYVTIENHRLEAQ